MTLAGVLISDHELLYKNNYYHSVFDTPASLNITFPVNISESAASNFTTPLGRRLQQLITNIGQVIYAKNSDLKVLNDQVDQITLNKLIYCFYQNSTCEFFKSILTAAQWSTYIQLLESNLPSNQLSFFTSVNDAQISGKWISQMLLKYFTRNSNFETLNSTECNKDSDSFKNLIQTKGVGVVVD